MFVFFIIDGVLGSSDERFVVTKHYHSFPKQLRKAGSRSAMLRFSDVGVRGVQYGLVAFIKAIFTSSIKIPRTRRNGFLPKFKGAESSSEGRYSKMTKLHFIRKK